MDEARSKDPVPKSPVATGANWDQERRLKTETETAWLVTKPQPSPQEEEGRRGAETVVGPWSQEEGPRAWLGRCGTSPSALSALGFSHQ